MNKKEVCLYFMDEQETLPRVHVSLMDNEFVKAFSFDAVEDEHYGENFAKWFEGNVSSMFSEFNFVFYGDCEQYFSLYKSLYERGARVSLVG